MRPSTPSPCVSLTSSSASTLVVRGQRRQSAAHRVSTERGEAAGERHQFVAVDSGFRPRFDHPQLAERKRSGLVEHDGIDGSEIFEESRALDQDAVTARHGNGGNRSGGRRQHQSAGARCHQNGKHGSRAVGHEPGAGREQHHQYHIALGVALEQPRDRRLRLLGLLEQGDNASQRGLIADLGDLDHQMSVEIEGAAQHTAAGRDLNRNQFTGNRGCLDAGHPGQHEAIRRNDVAGEELDTVADAQGSRFDLFGLAAGRQAPRPGLGQSPQSTNGLSRAQEGPFFEDVANGHHQGKKRRRCQVAMGPGGDESECHELVGYAMQVRVSKAGPGGNERGHGYEQRRHASDELGHVALAGSSKPETGGYQQTSAATSESVSRRPSQACSGLLSSDSCARAGWRQALALRSFLYRCRQDEMGAALAVDRVDRGCLGEKRPDPIVIDAIEKRTPGKAGVLRGEGSDGGCARGGLRHLLGGRGLGLGEDAVPGLIGPLRRGCRCGPSLSNFFFGLLHRHQNEIEGGFGAARDSGGDVDAAYRDAETSALCGKIIEPTIDRIAQIGAQLLSAQT